MWALVVLAVLLTALALSLGFMIGFDAGGDVSFRKLLNLLHPDRKIPETRCPSWLVWFIDSLGSRRWNDLPKEFGEKEPTAQSGTPANVYPFDRPGKIQ